MIASVNVVFVLNDTTRPPARAQSALLLTDAMGRTINDLDQTLAAMAFSEDSDDPPPPLEVGRAATPRSPAGDRNAA